MCVFWVSVGGSNPVSVGTNKLCLLKRHQPVLSLVIYNGVGASDSVNHYSIHRTYDILTKGAHRVWHGVNCESKNK